MKPNRADLRKQHGLSLVVTLAIVAGVSVLVGGVLYYTSTQSALTRRINQYEGSVAAALAATEKVVTRINRDFHVGGEATVINSLGSYRDLVPTDAELTQALNDLNLLQTVGGILGGGGSSSKTPGVSWAKYEFADALGQANHTHVEQVSGWAFRDVRTKFTGIRGYSAIYRVISNAREVNRPFHIVSAVKQEVEIAAIPLSQYQFYYVPDLELNPSTAGIRLNGPVHCNGNIYLQPSTSLVFENHATAARKILHQKHPSDPVARSGSGSLTYRAERESAVNTLNLPLGSSVTVNDLRQIVEAPTNSAESITSPIGKERFYNKADLVIVVSNDLVIGRSGAYNGGSVIVPWLATRGIVTRNGEGFEDARQCEDVQLSEFDLAKFLLNYSDLTTLLGRQPKVIWITDLGGTNTASALDPTGPGSGKGKAKGWWKRRARNQLLTSVTGVVQDQGASNVLAAVRLLNGQTLPAAGLTIATPEPLYVQGDFNLNSAPACLAADAVTVLSGSWVDANSTNSVTMRVAANTAINAAVVTGIVPTTTAAYSGGAENALRLLETWTGKTLTFNGTIIVLYYSQYATAPWGTPNVYSPPTRNWSYDTKLRDSATTPAGMPAARTIFREDWTTVKPYSKL